MPLNNTKQIYSLSTGQLFISICHLVSLLTLTLTLTRGITQALEYFPKSKFVILMLVQTTLRKGHLLRVREAHLGPSRRSGP